MTNVLATDLAELSFAQFVDGLPLFNAAIDMSMYRHTSEEHVFKHRELCSGVMEQARALTLNFRSDQNGNQIR
jgi:hypothetical protein